MRCKERTRNNSEDYPNYRECTEQAKNILANAYNVRNYVFGLSEFE